MSNSLVLEIDWGNVFDVICRCEQIYRRHFELQLNNIKSFTTTYKYVNIKIHGMKRVGIIFLFFFGQYLQMHCVLFYTSVCTNTHTPPVVEEVLLDQMSRDCQPSSPPAGAKEEALDVVQEKMGGLYSGRISFHLHHSEKAINIISCNTTQHTHTKFFALKNAAHSQNKLFRLGHPSSSPSPIQQ